MEDKSNIEILEEFARSTNRDIAHKEIPYPLTGIHTFRKYKKYIFIPYSNSEKSNYFIWYSNPYASVGDYTVFSGAFIPISSRVKSSLNIRSKTILDKVNIFSKKKANRVGNDNFDSKVVITGEIDSAARRLLSQSKIQSQLLKALEIANFMTISINEYNIDFVPELKDKSYLSIINPQSWDLEKDTIEEIFRLMERIRNIINYSD
ncbi:MAG: hypothetical protein QM503_01550 [Bacteroidota bacterium]